MFMYKQRMISIWFKTTSISKMLCIIWCSDSNPLWNLSLQMHVSRWAELTRACNLRWWGCAQHLATWSTNLAEDLLKGNKGICVSWGPKYNNKPVVYKSMPSHYRWVIAFIFPTIYPLWRLPDQVWVHAFWAVLDSPFVLAFVWSPASLPFPLAHCELQRMRGWV